MDKFVRRISGNSFVEGWKVLSPSDGNFLQENFQDSALLSTFEDSALSIFRYFLDKEFALDIIRQTNQNYYEITANKVMKS